jgi:hypothetical protein
VWCLPALGRRREFSPRGGLEPSAAGDGQGGDLDRCRCAALRWRATGAGEARAFGAEGHRGAHPVGSACRFDDGMRDFVVRSRQVGGGRLRHAVIRSRITAVNRPRTDLHTSPRAKPIHGPGDAALARSRECLKRLPRTRNTSSAHLLDLITLSAFMNCDAKAPHGRFDVSVRQLPLNFDAIS